MSKSVLVIDTPEKCDLCDLCCITFYPFCKVNARDIIDLNIVPDWCPLKPLPEKKSTTAPVSNYEVQKNLFAAGWNTCIDEITGGNADD